MKRAFYLCYSQSLGLGRALIYSFLIFHIICSFRIHGVIVADMRFLLFGWLSIGRVQAEETDPLPFGMRGRRLLIVGVRQGFLCVFHQRFP